MLEAKIIGYNSNITDLIEDPSGAKLLVCDKSLAVYVTGPNQGSLVDLRDLISYHKCNTKITVDTTLYHKSSPSVYPYFAVGEEGELALICSPTSNLILSGRTPKARTSNTYFTHFEGLITLRNL